MPMSEDLEGQKNHAESTPVEKAFLAYRKNGEKITQRDIDNFTSDQLEELMTKIREVANRKLQDLSSKNVVRERAKQAAKKDGEEFSKSLDRRQALKEAIEPDLMDNAKEAAAPYLHAGVTTATAALDATIKKDIPVVSSVLYSIRHSLGSVGEISETVFDFMKSFVQKQYHGLLATIPGRFGNKHRERLLIIDIEEALDSALAVHRKRYAINFKKDHLEQMIGSLPPEQKNPAFVVDRLSKHIKALVAKDPNAGKQTSPMNFSFEDFMKEELTKEQLEAQKKKEEEEKLKVTQEKVRALWGNGYDVRFGGDKRVYAEKNGDKWIVTLPVADHTDPAKGALLTLTEKMLQKSLTLPAQEIEVESGREMWEMSKLPGDRVKLFLPFNADTLLTALPDVVTAFKNQQWAKKLAINQVKLKKEFPTLMFTGEGSVPTLLWNGVGMPNTLEKFFEKPELMQQADENTTWEYRTVEQGTESGWQKK